MKRILIDGGDDENEEIRVVSVDGQRLRNIDIQRPGQVELTGSIFTAQITHVESSLQAGFVEYHDGKRHGFLPRKEVSPEYLRLRGIDENAHHTDLNVQDILQEGQKVLVQVEKEQRGAKGAALSTYITLAGCYLVLLPNNPGAGGISRRIEGEERAELREIIENLNLPEGMGLIARTACEGKSREELEWDFNILIRQWEAIAAAFREAPSPSLIYQEGDILSRIIRDHLRNDIVEVLVDDPNLYERFADQVSRIRPEFLDRIKLNDSTTPLFSRFQIETQIESAFQREVRLPSGGAIVIDHTEALISIDVNSARSTKASDIEETALRTNLEAADEAARQLRLRDLGGLVVIDFIDMSPTRNQREVENRLKEALKEDRARVQVGRISRFGLLEMSRQRLHPALSEAIQMACPRCHGHGTIRNVESLGFAVLRLIEETASRSGTAQVQAQVPTTLATFLLNEKRNKIISIEEQLGVSILIIPNPLLETPAYKIKRLRQDELEKYESKPSSYQIKHMSDEEKMSRTEQDKVATPAPLVEAAAITPPPPSKPGGRRRPSSQPKESLLRRVFSSLFGSGQEKESTANSKRSTASRRNSSRKQTRTRSSTQRNSTARKSTTSNTRGNTKTTAGSRSKTNSRTATKGTRTGQRKPRDNRNGNRNNVERKSGGNKATPVTDDAENRGNIIPEASMNQADAPSSAKVADDNRGNTWVEPAENITENDAGNSAQENIGNTIESLPPEIEEDTPADNIGNVVGANDGKEGGNEKSTQRRNNNRRRGPRSRNLRRRNNSPQQEG